VRKSKKTRLENGREVFALKIAKRVVCFDGMQTRVAGKGHYTLAAAPEPQLVFTLHSVDKNCKIAAWGALALFFDVGIF